MVVGMATQFDAPLSVGLPFAFFGVIIGVAGLVFAVIGRTSHEPREQAMAGTALAVGLSSTVGAALVVFGGALVIGIVWAIAGIPGATS